jgi:hypothetical protein
VNKKEFEGLSFNGNKKAFGTWKDQVLGHLRKEDSKKKVECLKAEIPLPKLRYEAFLLGTPPLLKEPEDGCTEKEKLNWEWKR